LGFANLSVTFSFFFGYCNSASGFDAEEDSLIVAILALFDLFEFEILFCITQPSFSKVIFSSSDVLSFTGDSSSAFVCDSARPIITSASTSALMAIGCLNSLALVGVDFGVLTIEFPSERTVIGKCQVLDEEEASQRTALSKPDAGALLLSILLLSFLTRPRSGTSSCKKFG
jgi:hypothetical protein